MICTMVYSDEKISVIEYMSSKNQILENWLSESLEMVSYLGVMIDMHYKGNSHYKHCTKYHDMLHSIY